MQITWRWALDFLLLPVLAGVPLARSCRTTPYGTRWRDAGVGLAWVRPPRASLPLGRLPGGPSTPPLPFWRVVGSSRCLRLASAPPWERLSLQILQALQILGSARNLPRATCGATGC
jgi:hypothetical protein